MDVFSYKLRRLGSQISVKLMRSRLGSPKRQRCALRLCLCRRCKNSLPGKKMNARALALFAPLLLLSVSSLEGQIHTRHSRYPNAPSNDPQLQLPTDQAQSCFTPESSLSGYDQFQQFDVFPQPASKGYLCINIPAGKTFVIDHLFAEADYDKVLPAPAEWYLNATVGNYEQMTGFAAHNAGALTANAHYLLSESVHMAVTGGTRVTLIMHSFYVSASNAIGETPGTASLALIGHWE
jgi:hypothetical protein